jgi:sulfonate transport system ATP-binding protein
MPEPERAHELPRDRGRRQALRRAPGAAQAAPAVEPGEIVSLLGASGCGKSTLLSIAAGLDPPARARAPRRPPLGGPDAGIGFVFQEPRLFPWLTVADNISFGGAECAEPARDRRTARRSRPAGLCRRAAQAAVGRPGPAGGDRARAVHRPRVLLLDEPFSAVDAITRMKLQDLLARVARERGLTVLLVTHDIDEAVQLSDRVCCSTASRDRRAPSSPSGWRARARAAAPAQPPEAPDPRPLRPRPGSLRRTK